MSSFIRQVGNPPTNDLFINNSHNELIAENNPNWIKYNNAITERINISNYYGFPSVILNSDFNWQRAIVTPITQAAGNGAYFSELWQIQGAGVATYSITSTVYAANDSDQSGSIYYELFQVSAYAGGDFYMYQQHNGAQFLRQYQNRIFPLSCKITNNQNKTITMRLDYFVYYDPTSHLFSGKSFSVEPGINEYADIIITDLLTDIVIGAAPYVQFRLTVIDLIDGTADLNIHYIKAELADEPTILYVDHALEETRIDNF